MSVDDTIARAFAEIEARGLLNPHRRFVGYDRISTCEDRRDDAERAARDDIAAALAKANFTVGGNAPAEVVFRRSRNNGHGFDLTLARIDGEPVQGLDDDLAVDLLNHVVHAMQLGELDWVADESGRELLTVSLAKP